MRLSRIYYILMFFLFVPAGIYAQTNKKPKLNKGTSKRQIKKKQKEAYKKNSDVNTFNPIQPMGSRQSAERDDIFWNSESANTVYKNAGNISLTTPSRYGIKQGLELSTVLGYDFWVPNLMLKKRWYNDRIIISTRHGLYCGTPGFHWAQKNGYYDFVDSLAIIPFILSVRNEIFFSYAIYYDVNCIQRQPTIVLTLSGGIDFGIPFGESTLTEINHHFLTNRSPALTGQGVTGYVKARGDWKAYDYLYLGTSFNFFFGNFTGNWSFENRTEMQTFITQNFSVSVGFVFSAGQYNIPSKSNVTILPFIDITWYFGQKESRQKGLFNKGMF